MVKSVKKIASNNSYFLISDIEIEKNKKKSYLQLIYNSVINGYFISLIKVGLKLFINKEYINSTKRQPLLFVNLDKLIKDLSFFVNKVTVINKNLTINIDRKHLLIKF